MLENFEHSQSIFVSFPNKLVPPKLQETAHSSTFLFINPESFTKLQLKPTKTANLNTEGCEGERLSSCKTA